jgi:hypothetical protein
VAQVSNRTMIRLAKKQLKKDNRKWPVIPLAIPEKDWPPDRGPAQRIGVYRSRDFLIQVFSEDDMTRISVNRTEINDSGQWCDDITWDELQFIKRHVGFSDKWAVEIYPGDSQIVNVANMRHLWILPEPPSFGWKKP